jgi:hypothetical protein
VGEIMILTHEMISAEIMRKKNERESDYRIVASLISEYLKNHKPLTDVTLGIAEREYDNAMECELFGANCFILKI